MSLGARSIVLTRDKRSKCWVVTLNPNHKLQINLELLLSFFHRGNISVSVFVCNFLSGLNGSSIKLLMGDVLLSLNQVSAAFDVEILQV